MVLWRWIGPNTVIRYANISQTVGIQSLNHVRFRLQITLQIYSEFIISLSNDQSIQLLHFHCHFQWNCQHLLDRSIYLHCTSCFVFYLTAEFDGDYLLFFYSLILSQDLLTETINCECCSNWSCWLPVTIIVLFTCFLVSAALDAVRCCARLNNFIRQ